MTRTIVWKEAREQAAVMGALAVMGCAVLAAAGTLLDPPEAGRATDLRAATSAGRLGLTLLVLTAGVVSGGTLFAGEREAGTLSFLDRLPGSRLGVWWRKVAAGAVLSGATATVLFGAAVALGLLGPVADLVGWAFLTGAVVAAAFGWGTVGSAVARSSLAACGVGVGLSGGAALLSFGAFAAVLTVGQSVFGPLNRWVGREYTGVVALMATSFTLIVLPLPVSAWLFTGPDRARFLAAVSRPKLRGSGAGAARDVETVRSGRRGFGARRLVWLSVRQLRMPALVLGAIGLAAGCAMLIPDGMPTLVWPPVAFVLGLLCGVVVLADEQGTAAARFWGERRLPVGRVWLAKVTAGAALCGVVVAAMLLPLTVGAITSSAGGRSEQSNRAFAVIFRSGLFADREFPALTYLLIWPAYGFVFGHLFAVVFRKPIVAGAVGLMVGGTAAGLWLPSLLGGGLHLWQPLAPLLVALLTARLLAWPWATDAVGTRRPLVRLAAGLAVAVAVAVAGVVWRVAEVPVIAEVSDDLRFATDLPTYDEKQAGRDLRRAVSLFGDTDAKVLNAVPNQPLLAPRDAAWQQPAAGPRPVAYLDRMYRVLEVGWPAGRPDLDAWADQAFVTKWDEPIFAAAAKPIGVLEDPNEMTYYTPLKNVLAVGRLGPLFLARGLQKQAHGDPDAFVPVLDAWLAAVRTTRHDTTATPNSIGRAFELMAYRALDRWLERLGDRPDLLRRALRVVRDHDAKSRFDPASIRLAEQVVVRNALNAPSRWLPRYLDEAKSGRSVGLGDAPGSFSTQSETETNVVGFAWTVPWERERHRRAVGLGNVIGGGSDEWRAVAGLPGGAALQPLIQETFPRALAGYEREEVVLAPRRAAILTLALRLAESDRGRLPDTLTALVPEYLPAVPADPYDGQPFRYRVSGGEVIEYDPSNPPPASLPPGRSPEILTGEAMTAVAGATGGGVCWPLEPDWFAPDFGRSFVAGWPPGMTPPLGPLIDAAAAVAGGTAYWSDPAREEDLGAGQPFPSRVPGEGVPVVMGAGGPGGASTTPHELWPWKLTANGREPVIVPRGQGILWSVGPGRADYRGAWASAAVRNGMGAGNLVYLVPWPAKK